VNRPQKRQRHGAGRGAADNHRDRTEATHAFYAGAREPSLPSNWRDRLPDPTLYYPAHVAGLSKPNATGWAHGACPLHDDRSESLSVHVSDARGGWHCDAGCGAGDLVAFHERLRGLSFKDAVADLLRWRP